MEVQSTTARKKVNWIDLDTVRGSVILYNGKMLLELRQQNYYSIAIEHRP